MYQFLQGPDLLVFWMHVDNGVVFTNSGALRDEVKSGMECNLKIKWEFEVTRVVGINVEQSNKIHLSQTHLANQIVDEGEGYLCNHILQVSLPLPDEQLVPR